MEPATSSSWRRLRLVADALGLARRTFWVIAETLPGRFAYNLLMIPHGRREGLTARRVGAMAGSSVTVVSNAVRLRWYGSRAVPTRTPGPEWRVRLTRASGSPS